ncbi:cardiolipin synthase [Brachybacterium endophyticum]|uniref:Cardiolipin synthase n=1 Tax=Brachybacterium endophyticum TaxID=2182385 RepID=A0A2U2RP85_9MICO|nr:cardiolipin synthase [Brachybacterium endophyticum]PWH07670.1 cardiolipin synthase [Brachybacterium endophyticum]
MEAWRWLVEHVVLVAPYVALVVDIILRVVAVLVVPRNRRPASSFAWLLAIMVFPIIGFPLFLLLGDTQLPRKRREKQQVVNRLMKVRSHDIPDSELDEDSPSWLQSAVALNRELGAFPLTGNNSADLEIEYEKSIRRMAEDIRTARESVHVLFYIAGLDETTRPFFDAVTEAADRGVKVRFLYDHYGSLKYGSVYRPMRRLLDAHDIEHYPMMPIKPLRDGALQRPDLRNHRKMLVVDGEVAWMGSQNLIDSAYASAKGAREGVRWQETMIRLRGPIVSEINLMFATDWYLESSESIAESQVVKPSPDTSGTYECQLVPSGPGFVLENNLLLFNQLFYSAERRIAAVSPYFVPDESLLYALVTAAKRGVEVELFVSEKGDQFLVDHAQSSYYSTLLEAGVRIQLYESPKVLHAKHVTVDDSVTVLGSSNMDIRSFLLDMESSLMVGGTDFMKKMHAVEDVYRSRSRELTLEEWRQRSVWRQFVDNTCRLASSIV